MLFHHWKIPILPIYLSIRKLTFGSIDNRQDENPFSTNVTIVKRFKTCILAVFTSSRMFGSCEPLDNHFGILELLQEVSGNSADCRTELTISHEDKSNSYSRQSSWHCLGIETVSPLQLLNKECCQLRKGSLQRQKPARYQESNSLSQSKIDIRQPWHGRLDWNRT